MQNNPDAVTCSPAVTCTTTQVKVEEFKEFDRDCNLMMFGYWEQRDSYEKEVLDVLQYLGLGDLDHYVPTVYKHNENVVKKVILRVTFFSPLHVYHALARAKRLKFSGSKVFLAKDLDYQKRKEIRACVTLLKRRIELKNLRYTGP